jgi:hypothetical protein
MLWCQSQHALNQSSSHCEMWFIQDHWSHEMWREHVEILPDW